MAKPPSPCIDVCKFKRAGHCIGCSMTKAQKKAFKKLEGAEQRRAFIRDLVAQQAELGKYRHWEAAYRRKCEKKGLDWRDVAAASA